MRILIRSLAFTLATALGSAAAAQNIVTVTGTVSPCVGITYPVHIYSWDGSFLQIDTTISTTANCTYSIDLYPLTPSGWFNVEVSCDGGLTWMWDSLGYSVANGWDTLDIDFTCGGTGCTACIDAIPATNGPAGPPIPWTIDAINCSTGGVAPVTYYYLWSDGSTGPPPHTYTQPGLYQVCIGMIDANGCESLACDSVYIDGDGTVDPVDPGDCTAAFWVMQGYETDPNNPNGVVPIPNELWIWNLSTSSNTSVALTMTTTAGSAIATLAAGCNTVQIGTQVSGPNIPAGTTIIAVDCPNVVLSQNATTTGIAQHIFTGITTGNYQFVWNWGDGTPDSTDPYPTHFYASGGPYALCLTMTDDLGCSDTACDSISVDGNGIYTGMILEENYARSGFTVNVLNQLPTGIPDPPAMESPVLWPNPVEDAINLSFNTTLNGNLPMSIIDLNGREVRRENVRIASGGNKLVIPVNELVSGIYLVRFGNDEKAVSFRFVKR